MIDFTAFDIHMFHEYVDTLDPKQIMLLLLPPIIGLILAIAVGGLCNRYVGRYIETHPTLKQNSWKAALIRGMKGAPMLIVVSLYLSFLTKMMSLPAPVEHLLTYIFFIILIITVVQVIARTATGVINNIIVARHDNISETSLLTDMVSWSIYVIGIIIILAECGISITPFITAMGIGGMALALGMQETMASIFAGFTIIFAPQIRNNDFVRLSNGQEGKIKDIAWRYTTIENLDGNTIVVPNQQIASAILTNYSMPAQDTRIKVPCGVSYDSDLDKVEAVAMEVAQRVQDSVTQELLAEKGLAADDFVPPAKPAVSFHTFGDSAIEFNVFLNCKAFTHQYRMKHIFIKELTKRFREEGIDIPFPIVTVKHDRADNGEA
ncbi:Potassium efflux system KefA protein / Small-conductance mechanosensitive channel [Anaerovibrio sp. JC8]|uniref:mechanosensitive ion channel family protein n=1 Tax=Anaerovibrio sp. JC8 TaxID=1240085 RepID=UPI000A0B957E|nr:mechanosensitive ion channel family protein [Anaerovibrio sp. JC8]ORU01053.1 Potassium efflux system KefA protein / Small-conductance mechanosensitive channel [Anaerovibrio sp. JC8]